MLFTATFHITVLVLNVCSVAVRCVILWRKDPSMLQVLRYGSVRWPTQKVSVWAAIKWTDPRIQLNFEALGRFYYYKNEGKFALLKDGKIYLSIRRIISEKFNTIWKWYTVKDVGWSVIRTLGHYTNLSLDGRRNATNIIIYNILSRNQRSNPAELKQPRPSSVIQLQTLDTDEAVICHQKLNF